MQLFVSGSYMAHIDTNTVKIKYINIDTYTDTDKQANKKNYIYYQKYKKHCIGP